MNWSRWFRCESSFGLLLVPNQPGIFALAEEVLSAPNGRRMLAVFEVDETDDLALSLSRMFALGSPWREKLREGKCFARYAVAPGLADRRAAAEALKQWLAAQRDLGTQIFAKAPSLPQPGEMRSERPPARAEHEGGVPGKPDVGLTGYDGKAAERCGALHSEDDDDDEATTKTVAERAVDRVARSAYGKVLRSGA
ncbi:MAG TPA: hypothetical protein VFP59_03160 [Candidatus Angelobacter sp.]|nr:hypothetical protein [Candidatus Angelobacter sp.]